jgi:PRC-barrel domain
MRHESTSDETGCPRVSGPPRAQWLVGLLAGVTITATLAPRLCVASATKLVIVDVTAVAEGYRASRLRGTTVLGSGNQKIGHLDDLVVSKNGDVLFAIIQVGGFLGVGSHFVAVPYSSLQISDDGRRIVLPGATKQQLESLREFKYQ